MSWNNSPNLLSLQTTNSSAPLGYSTDYGNMTIQNDWKTIMPHQNETFFRMLVDSYLKYQGQGQRNISQNTSIEEIKEILEQKRANSSVNQPNSEEQLVNEVYNAELDKVLIFIGSALVVIGSIYILYCALKPEKKTFMSKKQSWKSQGMLYKKIFLYGLFFTNISRAITFLFDATTESKDLDLTLILMDLPTLFFMTSFSVFIYYFAKLTMQVETYKLKNTLYYEENSNKESYDEKRQHLLSKNTYESDLQLKKKYKMPNLIKPFFIVFNIFTYLAYVIICVYFARKMARNEEEQQLAIQQQSLLSTQNSTNITDREDYDLPKFLPNYYKAISGLNGLMFLMLALAVLNYGSRLETMISQTKPKFATSANQEQETSRKPTTKRLSETNQEFMAINEASRKILHGLDLRIFLITICLSMLFFVVSVSEFLTAWDVIQKSQAKWKILLFYICTEVCPSIILAYFLTKVQSKKKKKVSKNVALSAQKTQEGKRGLDIRQSQLSDERSGQQEDDDQDSTGGQSDEGSGEDSYGSFNPNLNKKSLDNSMEGQDMMPGQESPNKREEIRMIGNIRGASDFKSSGSDSNGNQETDEENDGKVNKEKR